MCLKYQLEGEDNWRVWRPPAGPWLPREDDYPLIAWTESEDYLFIAHNAGFEQAIWRNIVVPKYHFPEIPLEQWECTMATAAWKGLRLGLDRVAVDLELPMEKDAAGKRLTLSMSRLDDTGNLPDFKPHLDRIEAYCEQDVKVEKAVEKRIGLISEQSDAERQIWLYDQTINQRGVRLDMDFVNAAQLVIDRATAPLRAEFLDLTGGITPNQVGALQTWCAMNGTVLPNLQKATVEQALGAYEELDDAGYTSNADDPVVLEQPPMGRDVRRVLEIRSMLGSAAVKKLRAMQACVGPDGRARGLLQYHAAGTGRWGGRLLQPQNFPRGDWKKLDIDPETTVDAIMSGDPAIVEGLLGVEPIQAVAASLRHALVPAPGSVFLVGDFAGIEARIVLALAGQHDKTQLMASGHDVYLDMACDIYNKPKGYFTIKDVKERTIGKNTVLGCGFQMGPDKFHARYCPDQPIEFAQQVITAYRETWAPKVPKLWRGLERAALISARGWGAWEEHVGIKYQYEKDDFVSALLPNNWQKLWYYKPLIGEGRFGKEAWSYRKAGHRVWAYGGLLTENVVQALARGLLCHAIHRLEQAGYPVVLTVHDEIVVEIPLDNRVDARLQEFKKLMETSPAWASRIGIPISVEEWKGERYRK